MIKDILNEELDFEKRILEKLLSDKESVEDLLLELSGKTSSTIGRKAAKPENTSSAATARRLDMSQVTGLLRLR